MKRSEKKQSPIIALERTETDSRYTEALVNLVVYALVLIIGVLSWTGFVVGIIEFFRLVL